MAPLRPRHARPAKHQTPGIRSQVVQAAAVASRVGGSPARQFASQVDVVPVVLADMKKTRLRADRAGACSRDDEVVDVRQPGLDRYERNGVGGVDKQLRPVTTRRGHNFVQGSGFSVLRPREAERGEEVSGPIAAARSPNGTRRNRMRRCSSATRWKEHRSELVVRNDDLDTNRQCGGDQPHPDGRGRNECDVFCRPTNQRREVVPA